MLFTSPAPEELYAALLARDPAYDGHAFVGVTTTRIFCRLTCPARKPKFEHTRFFASIRECIEAGFRACQRCQPLAEAREREPLVAMLLGRLEREPERVWGEEDLVALGIDPSTVRRAFKRHLGMTFLDLARLRQAGRGVARIAAGASVIDAQLDSGFESGSGFREAVARLIGETPAALKGRDLLLADWIETPIGAMLAVADARALHLLEFFDRKALAGELTRLRLATRSAITFGRNEIIGQVGTELHQYFAGQSANFTTRLTRHGPEYTQKVWEALLAIPPGETRAYREVAAAIGHAGAFRAVARANGANQIAIIIPCHRVIGADGELTGYAGGLWRKRWLIEHERRAFGRPAAEKKRSKSLRTKVFCGAFF